MVGAANIEVPGQASIRLITSSASKPLDSGTTLTPSRATCAIM